VQRRVSGEFLGSDTNAISIIMRCGIGCERLETNSKPDCCRALPASGRKVGYYRLGSVCLSRQVRGSFAGLCGFDLPKNCLNCLTSANSRFVTILDAAVDCLRPWSAIGICSRRIHKQTGLAVDNGSCHGSRRGRACRAER